MGTAKSLARIGTITILIGALLLIAATLLHPLDSDPADAPAAFAEYTADPKYVWTHLGQFAGFAGLGIGLVAFASTFEPGRAAAWAQIGAAGMIASIAVAAALQAVDGVALKAMVDRWATATQEARPLAFEAALAVRWIEIGLAGFLSVLSGLAVFSLGVAILSGARYPTWLGVVGALDGLGMLAAGAAQASMGFSGVAMMLSMVSSSAFLLWAVLAGVLMWRRASLPLSGRP